MTRAALILAVALALIGCASVPVVEIPITELALMYADAKAEVAVAVYALTDACRTGRLSPPACERLAAAYQVAKGIEARVEIALANPKRPIDPALVREYLGHATGILGAVAGLVGKGLTGGI